MSKNATNVVNTRNIDFRVDGEEMVVNIPIQNPYKYGLSTSWMEKVEIPQPDIDFDKPDEALKVYGDFIGELRRWHNGNLGFQRWVFGSILNRLKPINGGAKEIPHGHFTAFVSEVLGISEDLSEEVRWVAETFNREWAMTHKWTDMRATALEIRARKSGKNPKGATFSKYEGSNPKVSTKYKGNYQNEADYALPQMQKRARNDLSYYQEVLKRLTPLKDHQRGSIGGEGIPVLLKTTNELIEVLTGIKTWVESMSKAA